MNNSCWFYKTLYQMARYSQLVQKHKGNVKCRHKLLAKIKFNHHAHKTPKL